MKSLVVLSLTLLGAPALADEDWATRCAARLEQARAEAARRDAALAGGTVEAFHYDKRLGDGRWRWFDVGFRVELPAGVELSAVALADETTRDARSVVTFHGARLAADGAPAATARAFTDAFAPALDDCRQMTR